MANSTLEPMSPEDLAGFTVRGLKVAFLNGYEVPVITAWLNDMRQVFTSTHWRDKFELAGSTRSNNASSSLVDQMVFLMYRDDAALRDLMHNAASTNEAIADEWRHAIQRQWNDVYSIFHLAALELTTSSAPYVAADELPFKLGDTLRAGTRDRFIRALIDSIRAEPMEDGFSHPAERIVARALEDHPSSVGSWLLGAYNQYEQTSPATAAAIVKCLVEMPMQTREPWGLLMMKLGLGHESVVVRDAAVTVLEHWGGDEALHLLRAHAERESVPWLTAHMNTIIKELSR